MDDSHRDAILDQFTRQAMPFSTSPGIRDEAALALVVDQAGTGPDDTVLDVACGPGILACAFARVARHVTGIDITPAMLDRARMLQRELGLDNVTWRLGDVTPLPFADEEFSIVVSRFAFHHFDHPAAVLREMVRVSAREGCVVVVDIAPARDKADLFNKMEMLRDSSHVRAIPLEELRALFAGAGLPPPREAAYRLEGELEGLLRRSFPKPADVATIRALFEDSIGKDTLDVAARRVGREIRYGYPVAVLAARRI
jgi:SAM-dependent methyltransferase